MKAHIFHYKWPGIKEGLVHEEHEAPHYWHLNEIYGPMGAWMYAYSNWYLRKADVGSPWSITDAHRVPKEIRATALILNT